MVYLQSGIDPDQIELSFGGVTIEDDHNLKDINIKGGSNLIMKVSLYGKNY